MVAVASKFMRKGMAQLGPLGKCVANPYGGAPFLGAWFNRNCSPVISVVAGCAIAGSIWGNCCSGSWNGGLFRFSDIIKDRKEVSFLDCLQAGLKEQAYTNPMGTISSALSAGGSLLGAVPSLLGGVGGLLGGVGGMFSGGQGGLFGGGGTTDVAGNRRRKRIEGAYEGNSGS